MLLNCGVGKGSWEFLALQGDQTSQFQRKSMLNIHRKNRGWSQTPILWPPDAKSWLIGKDPEAGKDWKQEKKGTTEDEMVRRGWQWQGHHWLNGHDFEQAPGDGEGQESLACYSPWDRKESDTTEWLNNKNSFPFYRWENWGTKGLKNFV